jgi:hypothetical protein
LFGADDAPSGAIEQAVFTRQHDDRRLLKGLVVFNQRTSLVAIQARHHDVDKYQVRLVIGDLRQSIKTVDRRKYLTSFFGQQRFGCATNRFAVINYKNLEPV